MVITLKILIALIFSSILTLLLNALSPHFQNSKIAKNAYVLIFLTIAVIFVSALTVSNPNVWNNLWTQSPKKKANIDTVYLSKVLDSKVHSIDSNTNLPRLYPNKIDSVSKNKKITVVDPEGNHYKFFEVDDLIWLGENLRTTADGEEMNFADTSDAHKYGKFYSFDGAKTACAKLGRGWRIPTVTEYQQLFLRKDGGYTEYQMIGANKAIGNPQNAYVNNLSGGKSGFNSLLSGYGFSAANKIIDLELKSKYWAANISGNPNQEESVKKDYFYSFTFDKNLKEITEFEYFSYGINEYNSCRCVINKDSIYAPL